MRDIIEIDEAKCDGCGQCVTACAEGAIAVINGKAKLVSEVYCDGLGACLGHCPQNAIRVIKRDAAAFDEAAVHSHLTKLGRPLPPPQHVAPAAKPAFTLVDPPRPAHQHGGCPGSASRTLPTPDPRPLTPADAPASALGHWPIQLALVNPAAPWLAGADVLLTAQCTAVAIPDFHQRWVAGRVVLLACPKLDDLARHTAKLGAILAQAKPRSLTVLRMEVPCCGGIAWAAQQAVDAAGTGTELKIVVIGIDGTAR
jgi:NAD-dependent dihydropyrimidine dehydrogenase PreA subunit